LQINLAFEWNWRPSEKNYFILLLFWIEINLEDVQVEFQSNLFLKRGRLSKIEQIRCFRKLNWTEKSRVENYSENRNGNKRFALGKNTYWSKFHLMAQRVERRKWAIKKYGAKISETNSIFSLNKLVSIFLCNWIIGD
jgi:hypothetical protein